MKLVFGEKTTLAPQKRENDADNVWGPAWHAQRRPGGVVLEYATGDHAGRDRSFAISEEEFERLRADPDQFEPIIHAHGG